MIKFLPEHITVPEELQPKCVKCGESPTHMVWVGSCGCGDPLNFGIAWFCESCDSHGLHNVHANQLDSLRLK